MGKIWMPGGGGGADLDVITVQPADVVAPKVYVDKEGEPATGILVDRIGFTEAISAKDSGNGAINFEIPKGAYRSNSMNGNPGIWMQRATVAAAGGLTAGKMISGQSAFGINGSIPTLGGQTITPGTSQQTVSSSGKYMTGNVVVNGDADLVAGNILNGVNIFGVTGNVRKYGVISRQISSGSATKYFSGDKSATLYYIELSPGFTPTNVSALLVGQGRDSSVLVNYGQFIVSKKGWDEVYSVESTMTAGSLIIPVCSIGAYNVLITGYY